MLTEGDQSLPSWPCGSKFVGEMLWDSSPRVNLYNSPVGSCGQVLELEEGLVDHQEGRVVAARVLFEELTPPSIRAAWQVSVIMVDSNIPCTQVPCHTCFPFLARFLLPAVCDFQS